MKKWLILLVCIVLVVSMVGCNAKDSTSSVDSAEESSAESSSVSQDELDSFTEEGVTFSLPKGYKKLAEGTSMYVADNYPADADNFVLIATPKAEGEDFDAITKEAYQEMLQMMLPDLTINEFEKTTISGLPALKIKYSVSLEGVSMEGVQLFINGDNTYTLTYTLVNGKLKDSIDKCVAAVSVAK